MDRIDAVNNPVESAASKPGSDAGTAEAGIGKLDDADQEVLAMGQTSDPPLTIDAAGR
jgi:hypothetical protein